MKKFFRTIFYISLFSPLVILPFISEIVSVSVKNSINVCISTLIPSIFPFLFFSLLIANLMGDMLSEIAAPLLIPILGISKYACRCVIIGLLGGFPAGAQDAANLYSEKKITKSEAERLPIFCNNAGLMFTIGAVGVSSLHSLKAGMLLYIYHLFASLIAALFTKSPKESSLASTKEKVLYRPTAKDFPDAFSFAVGKSIKTLGIICANFTIFKVVCDILCHYLGRSTKILFLSGLIEFTGGVLSMPDSPYSLILISFLLSFSGLSVIMQSMSFFAPLGLSVKKLFLGSLFKAALSAFLMYVTFPENLLSGTKIPSMAFYISAVALPFILIFLFILKKTKASAQS